MNSNSDPKNIQAEDVVIEMSDDRCDHFLSTGVGGHGPIDVRCAREVEHEGAHRGTWVYWHEEQEITDIFQWWSFD